MDEGVGPPVDEGPPQEDLVEHIDPEPGFMEPQKRELHRELVRWKLVLAILVYLALWAFIATGLLIVTKNTEGTIQLVELLAAPVVPLLGIAMGFYFGRKGPDA